MDFPTVLLRDLVHLGNTLDLDGDDLTSPLHDLVAALQTAVPSYRGLCLSLVDNGSAVRLSYFLPSLDGDAVATSFCLPFDALGVDVSTESRIVFYALTPGAFVDLAADLSHALDVPTAQLGDGRRDGRRIVLDADLPPTTLVSGVTGLDDASAINRAVGILLHQGHHPHRAHAELRRRAAAAGLETPAYAARLLKR